MDYLDYYEPTAGDFEEPENKNLGNEVNADDEKKGELADVIPSKEGKKRRFGPRQTLTIEKLSGDHGILELRKILGGTKFRGKGHEVEDLNTMMAALEYWAHRLCPKMTFDEVLEKIEDLGSKRPVQTALTKLRLGESIVPGVESVENAEAAEFPANFVPDNDHSVLHGVEGRRQMEEKIDLTDDQRRKIEENKRRAQELRATKAASQTIDDQRVSWTASGQAIQTFDDDLDEILGNWEPDASDLILEDKAKKSTTKSEAEKNQLEPISKPALDVQLECSDQSMDASDSGRRESETHAGTNNEEDWPSF